MNSLVVLFSMIALAAAKPSSLGAPILAYSLPGSAVSQQSRVDIKASPAIISTAAVAPIIAEPAIAPVALAGPAAVSHQSRIDVKSSPAVVNTLAIGTPIAAPLAYSASFATAGLAPALLSNAIAPTLLKTAVIATPAIAPGLIKSSLLTPGLNTVPIIAGPTVPLDTPEVIAARAAHLEAKALANAHLIKKRSVLAATSPLISTYSAGPYAQLTLSPAISPISPLSHAISPIAPLSPITYSAPLITKTYGVHAW